MALIWPQDKMKPLRPPGRRVQLPATAAAAFWRRVDKSGGPDVCWPWAGAISPQGYGFVYWRGQSRGAHCVAWEINTRERQTKGVVIRHGDDCTTRLCCNPKHLSSGTSRDNFEDMVRVRAKRQKT